MKLANSPDMRNTSLYFYDLNAKINYRINDNNRLFLLGYLGRDNLSTDYMGMSFGNKTATLRWNHIFLPKLFSIYMVDVLLYGQLPESEHNYLNVQAFKNGVAINGKLANFSIIVSENAVNKEINGEQCLYLFRKNDNSELMSQSSGFTPVEDGDLIRVQVSSITKEYAEYVLNAQKELQGTMPIFSGPPANVKSNIKAVSPSGESEVCGFFTAYSKRSSSPIEPHSKAKKSLTENQAI